MLRLLPSDLLAGGVNKQIKHNMYKDTEVRFRTLRIINNSRSF